jgi:hypothetical protein
MACKDLPKESRPKVLYCGNSAIAKRVKEGLERETVIVVAPNIRPSIDQEDLAPAELLLAKVKCELGKKDFFFILYFLFFLEIFVLEILRQIPKPVSIDNDK